VSEYAVVDWAVLGVAKVVARLSRLTRRGDGTALPGLLVERIQPGLGQRLARQLPRGVVVVTGTNGKTTTTKLVAGILEAAGERVLTNRTGSNLWRGVVSALINSASLTGRITATIALFEVDEAALRRVATELQPKHIVVLNLFRDQLDRYGELDVTARYIGQGIASTQASVYLNADDPLVASLGRYANPQSTVSYFGMDAAPTAAGTPPHAASDSERCPRCGTRLGFSHTFYSHIGHYRCEGCGYERPEPRVKVSAVQASGPEGTRCTVEVDGASYPLALPLPGTYNLSNALAALALSSGLGVDVSRSVSTLSSATAAFGRAELVEVHGRMLHLLLVKNPVGFAAVLETFLLPSRHSQVLILINDNIADGRDVSWLWDVPVEAFADTDAQVMVSGTRGTDMALRLKYAGIPARHVDRVAPALRAFLSRIEEGGTGFVLPTYTAMLEVRSVLGRWANVMDVAA
jgi:UDP-N-acetylmuramyl tripeptide synthase